MTNVLTLFFLFFLLLFFIVTFLLLSKVRFYWGSSDDSAERPMDDIFGVSGQQHKSNLCHIHDNEGNLYLRKDVL